MILGGTLSLLAGDPGLAATLSVGPGQAFGAPSEAARAARDGDAVVIAPGEYYDCAVWSADDLTVLGSGPGVTLTDAACDGKAAFITRGERITLRDLTFTRIRAPDRNGAGIRVEDGSLTVERCRFVNDQLGILIAGGRSATIRDSAFEANGVTGGATADILAGRIALLRVEGSRFSGARGSGPLVSSAAARTEFSRDRLEAAAAQPSVIGASGGGLEMDGDEIVLEGAAPRLGAILATGDGDVALTRVMLVNRTGSPAALLRDWGSGATRLEGNVVAVGDTESTTSGALLYRAKQAAHRMIDWLRELAGQFRHLAASGLRRLLG